MEAQPNGQPAEPDGGLARRGQAGRTEGWWLLAAGLLGFFVYSLYASEFEWGRLSRTSSQIARFFSQAWPPNWSDVRKLVPSLWQTIVMAYAGTALGAIVSLPLAALATRGVLPRWGNVALRFMLNAWRTVPSIVWALFFVSVAGLGAMPGVLALSMYSCGYLTKFYYDAFESADPAVKKALIGLGGTNLQVFLHATLPESAPIIASQTIYVFEYNVRAASILGIVGAGGIGYYLNVYWDFFQYDKALACLILLLGVVLTLDFLSSMVRRKLRE